MKEVTQPPKDVGVSEKMSEPVLSPELKAKWLEALRSGKYPQAPNYLYANGAYCCLGVLHEVITGQRPGGCWGYKSPRPSEIAPLANADLVRVLADMNDDGKTFPEIADYIEANIGTQS